MEIALRNGIGCERLIDILTLYLKQSISKRDLPHFSLVTDKLIVNFSCYLKASKLLARSSLKATLALSVSSIFAIFPTVILTSATCILI